ncbi:MAG: SOS response-associated peptidase [Bacteroidia bacterium]|nr:SOS response-associated peptidase [Bacteroidia bacterium]
MCGRYTYTRKPDPARAVLPPDEPGFEPAPRYNLAPSQRAPVIPADDPGHIHFYRWGLIPHWAKDAKIGYSLINARAETAADKPAFRRPFQSGRCLALADSFYEWKAEGRHKQPYRILLRSGEPFYMAALCDAWRSPEGRILHSFTILTTEPNGLMASLHDRMPVILGSDAARRWLRPETPAEELHSLLRPFPEELMQAYPVSAEVGNVRNDHPGLIQPLNP